MPKIKRQCSADSVFCLLFAPVVSTPVLFFTSSFADLLWVFERSYAASSRQFISVVFFFAGCDMFLSPQSTEQNSINHASRAHRASFVLAVLRIQLNYYAAISARFQQLIMHHCADQWNRNQMGERSTTAGAQKGPQQAARSFVRSSKIKQTNGHTVNVN